MKVLTGTDLNLGLVKSNEEICLYGVDDNLDRLTDVVRLGKGVSSLPIESITNTFTSKYLLTVRGRTFNLYEIDHCRNSLIQVNNNMVGVNYDCCLLYRLMNNFEKKRANEGLAHIDYYAGMLIDLMDEYGINSDKDVTVKLNFINSGLKPLYSYLTVGIENEVYHFTYETMVRELIGSRGVILYDKGSSLRLREDILSDFGLKVSRGNISFVNRLLRIDNILRF